MSSDDDFGPHFSGIFDFTILFEQSILSILPTALFLLVAPFRIASLFRRSACVVSGPLLWFKLTTVLIYLGLQIALLALWTRASSNTTRTSLPEAVLGLIEAVVIAFLSYTEHLRSIKPSFLLNGYLTLTIILEIALARTFWIRNGMTSIASVFTTLLVVKSLLLVLEELPKRPIATTEKEPLPRETVAGIINRSVFWWLNKLFWTGARLLIGVDDLGPIGGKFESSRLLNQLETNWEQDKNKEGAFVLLACTFRTFQWQFYAGILPRLLFSAFTFAQPFLVTSVILYVEQERTEEHRRITGGLIGATALIYVGLAITQAFYKHMTYQLLTMVRGALASLVFKKMLRLESTSIKDSAPVTLMSTDIEAMIGAGDAMHDIWASTLELPVGIYLLYRQVGIPSLFILVPTLLTTIMGGLISPSMGVSQKNWNDAVQERLGSTNSMLSQIKAIKMVGLAGYFHKHLQEMRKKELDQSIGYRLHLVAFNSLAIVSAHLTPIIIILAAIFWSRAEQGLTISEAFTSLALIGIASNPLISILISLMQLSGAVGCFTRLQAFLNLEERNDFRLPSLESAASPITKHDSGVSKSELQHQVTKPSSPFPEVTIPMSSVSPPLVDDSSEALQHPIQIQNATFVAGEDVEVLKSIDMVIPRCAVSMIVGRVGSGKSSVLKAMLGELVLKSGKIVTSTKSMAYCDQTPWLQNISIRDNILGSSPLDEKWLSTVIYACALDEDLAVFPQADLTLVGSGGVALSGGQKQRVALARAVYSRKPLVILDDVFSGLDSTTMHSVFHRLLGPQGLLRENKSTVVLVTNQVNFLPLADHITMVNDGRIIHNQVSYNALEPSVWGVIERDVKESAASATEAAKEAVTGVSKQQQATSSEEAKRVEADLARQTGDSECYKIYLRSWGTLAIIIVMVTSVAQIGLSKMPQIWLRLWVANGTATRDPSYVGAFVAFGVSSVLLGAIGLAYFVVGVIPQSAIYLHNQLLRSVMRAPLFFFTNTDLGVTLNRFSQDMTLIDQVLPMTFWATLITFLTVLAETGLIASGSSYVGATIPGVLLVLYFVQKFYLRTSRQMRFLDIESKAPLYTQFTEALAGLTTIRAFGWTNDFLTDNHKRLNVSQKPFYMQFCLHRWLQIVLDLLMAGLALILVAFALNFSGTTSSAGIGLAMVSLIGFNSTLAMFIGVWAELETSLGAIARLKWFIKYTPSEEKEEERQIPVSDWPQQGMIEMQNVSASYRDDSNLVLRDVSLKILPGQKVGICGRTGSGKSSLILTILRLLELRSGSIRIDDLDLSTMPRQEIRSHLTTLPQEPLKLTGSIRYNLDPEGIIQADESLISVLVKTSVWSAIESRGGLDATLEDLGLSAGQLQLFCLARALLSRTSVVLLDEATSNVDRQTDQEIRRVIKEEMSDRTVLEVAHRLDIISDYDVVIVMGEGRVLEMGAPNDLLQTPSSAFRALHEDQTL